MRKVLIGVVLALVVMIPVSAALAQGGPLTIGSSVEGSLDGSTMSYTIDLAAEQTVNIMLVSDAFDAYLTLQDPSGSDVAWDDDSAGNLNSSLVYTATAAGTYTIIVSSYGGGAATGAFTLSASEAQIIELTYNTPLTVEMNNAIQYFSFQGTEGDVLNIFTDDPDVDVRLSLMDATGNEIYYDDDGGPGYAASIRRAILPSTGTYSLTMEPVFDAVGPVVLTVETTEIPVLGAEPYVVTLGGQDSPSLDRVLFEAAAGTSYRLTVSASGETSAYIQIEVGEYDWYSLNFTKAMEASMVFTVTQSGTFPIEISDSSYQGVDYSLLVEAVK